MEQGIPFAADVMRSLGAKTIIAVDVGAVYEPRQTNYGDSLSGWWLLWNKWNPFGSNIKVCAASWDRFSCLFETRLQSAIALVSGPRIYGESVWNNGA